MPMSPVVSGMEFILSTRAGARHTAWELCRSGSKSALMCGAFTGIFNLVSSHLTLG
jgi:hypothetical protein